MQRRLASVTLAAAFLLVAFAAITPTASPVRLARHPDYHAGRSRSAISATSGSRARTAPNACRAHRQPRAGGVSALLARRALDRVLVESLRQLRRVRRPGGRRHAEAADVSHRQRRRGRLDARFAAGRSSARRTATARSRTSRRCIRSRSAAARRSRCRSIGAIWGSFSPDGKSLVFNRHPAVVVAPALSRQLRGGSVGRRPGDKTYTKLLGDERYNRYWPMWGADDAIYFVADPLPNDKTVKPGSPDVRKSVNNIYKIPAKGGQPVQVTKHTDGNLFWPSMSSDGKVIVYEEQLRHLEARRRDRARPARSRSTSPPTRRRTKWTSRRSPTRSMRSTSRRPAAAR